MVLLAEIGEPAITGKARTAAEAGKPIVRVAAAWVLHSIGVEPERQIERLCGFLRSTDKTEKRFAAEALGELKAAQAVDALIELLRSDDDDLRCAAAEALGTIRDARAVVPLIAALDDEDEYVRQEALLALGSIGDPRAVEHVAAHLWDPPEDYDPVQTYAARALAMLKDARSIEPLRKAQQADECTRVWATAALLWLDFRPEEQMKKLADWLHQEDEGREVPWALACIRDRRAAGILIDALCYCSEWERIKLADALAELTGQHFGCRILKWREWWQQNGEVFLKGEQDNGN